MRKRHLDPPEVTSKSTSPRQSRRRHASARSSSPALLVAAAIVTLLFLSIGVFNVARILSSQPDGGGAGATQSGGDGKGAAAAGEAAVRDAKAVKVERAVQLAKIVANKDGGGDKKKNDRKNGTRGGGDKKKDEDEHAADEKAGGLRAVRPPVKTKTKGKDGSTEKKHGGGRRVIAVGDIHGDKNALVHALQLAGVVDHEMGTTWTGGKDAVVQIGDLLNKSEPRDEETLLYVTDMAEQAAKAGGSLVVTVGDHDLYHIPSLWHSMEKLKGRPFPKWVHAAYVLDKTLFVHGSLSKTVFDVDMGSSIEKIDEEARAWLAGNPNDHNKKENNMRPKWVGRGDGPIHSRLYSKGVVDDPQHCDDLKALLEELKVDRMVVGHTLRKEGISSVCDGRAWRIDVGLSETETKAGKLGASEVLELSDGGRVATVLSTEVKLDSWKKKESKKKK